MKIGTDTRVFVAGCGGMLGQAVYTHFSQVGCKVLATDILGGEPWLTFADVRNFDSIARAIRDFSPDLIINLAAITDLELCETDKTNAWATNALGAENVGLIARRLDVPYVFISTAGVFDGRQDEYTDFDEPNPINHYGRSKLYGERWTLRTLEKAFVLRAGWMMGGGVKDKKFVHIIYEQIAGGKKTIYAVNDKWGTPTYTSDFAYGIQRIVESDLYGLYNQVCSGSATRLEVAQAVVFGLGLSESVRVQAVTSAYFQEKYFARRPTSEQLINLKLDSRGLNVMRHWRVCLNEYLDTFRGHL